jgi:hypothetical protein
MYLYLCIFSAIALGAILVPRYIGISKSKAYYANNGLEEFISNTKELITYFRRLYRHLKKITQQYSFHFLVRMLYYVQLFWNKAYTWARNGFMKSAVRDKKAVSRFWETLKEYKQEIDEEKKK